MPSKFGEGVALTELFALLQAVRKHDLHLEVKILDEDWQPFSPVSIQAIVKTIQQGSIKGGADVRLRLHGKETAPRNAAE